MAQADIDWLKSHPKVGAISPFGESVASLLGDLYRGIYHIDDNALFHKRVHWDSTYCIEQEMIQLAWPQVAQCVY
jgi:hypothetical protein